MCVRQASFACVGAGRVRSLTVRDDGVCNPQGAVTAVVRAVPVAILKPLIGTSEAVSRTLFGE